MSVTPEIKLEHSDSRGEIYSITLPGDRELMLLFSKKGSLRGGHSHDVDEVVMVLTGKMRYHKRIDDSKQEIDLRDGQESYNGAGEVHMGEFLEDTWLIEWKHARKGEWKNNDDPVYRARVQANAAS